jgi:tetratricopeptide (TPR) repeat protein
MSISSSAKGKNDEFVTEVTSFFDVLAKRSGVLIGVGVGVLVAAGVLAFVSSKNEQKSDAGRSALYLAEKNLDTQEKALTKILVPAPVATAAPKGTAQKPPQDLGTEAIAYKKLDVDTQFADSVTKLKAVATDFSGTRAGFDSMLVLGKLYLNHGEPAKAAEWFSKSTEHAPASLDRALAWNSLGYAYENDTQYKEAMSAFDQALSVGEATLKGDLLLSKARVAEEMNDSATAKTVYDQIQSQLPNTDYSKQAELYKSRLK